MIVLNDKKKNETIILLQNNVEKKFLIRLIVDVRTNLRERNEAEEPFTKKFHDDLLEALKIIRNSRCRQIVELLEGLLEERAVEEKTWNWLYNERTGYPLRIDAYFPRSNLAFEYDGYQHYTFPNCFHKTKEQFEESQKIDQLKSRLLEQHTIPLLRLRADESYDREYLKQKLLELKI